ncbi:MAG: hypothetical protein U5K76_02005 [Woeseiaceae bacterium]|nr:hypothetical protein [Woeseiaceae bacterium]
MRLLSAPSRQSFGFIVAIVSAAAAGAAGQGEPVDGASEALDEIVVVANKQPRSIRDVAANVTILASDDLDSILRRLAGGPFRLHAGNIPTRKRVPVSAARALIFAASAATAWRS